MMPFRLALILTSIMFSYEASSDFFSYATWAALPAHSRSLYIAGLIDGLMDGPILVPSPSSVAIARHFYSCLSKANLTNNQLAENVLDYARSRPQFHGGLVVFPMIDYLKEVCGPPAEA